MKLKVGVIGAGRIGRVHAENLAARIPEAELSWVADVRLEAARAAAGGGARATDDHRRVLEDRDTRAVVICTSTDTHAGLIEEAAAAGKHVFCEKPLDLDPDRIRRSLAAVERAGVRLQVGFNRRFDPGFRRVRELIRSGELGVPQLLRITSRDPQPPPLDYVKVSGGLFLDMAIHDFDMARFLLGEVLEVQAFGSVLVEPGIGALGDVDTAVTVLRFAGGALGAIDNSRKAVYGYDQRLEVLGSKGCASAPNVAATEVAVWDAGGRRQEPPHHFFIERYRDAYLAELREFAAALLAGRAPEVGGADGLKAVLVGLAARRSLAERRPVLVEEVSYPTPR